MEPSTHRTPAWRGLRFVANALVIATVSTLAGCTLCQDCGDLDYPTYGGAWERTRRDSGRVGSIFDPAGARTAALVDRDPAASDSGDRRSDESIENGSGKDDASPDSDDRDSDRDRSPSDRDGEDSGRLMDGSLNDLNLEDIQIERGEILPPDI